jgi:MoxR-like ATPase
VAALLSDIQRLHDQVGAADAAYRTAQRKLARQHATSSDLHGTLSQARRALHDSRIAAGRLARMQYQGTTEISPYVGLLLARDPQHALEQGHMLQRVSAARASVVRRLADNERRAKALAAAGAAGAGRTGEEAARRRTGTPEDRRGAARRGGRRSARPDAEPAAHR